MSLAEWMQRHLQPERVALIVGPEGGLTNEEVVLCMRYRGVSVSLMPRILRTETAALVAVSQLLLAEYVQLS